MSAHFTIKHILKDHWDSFLEETPNVRSVVIDEVDRVLSCGDPKMGFALYKCPRCESVRFVPFRCHSRFCSTCGTAYQDNRAASIEEKLINCRHRHIVFTMSACVLTLFKCGLCHQFAFFVLPLRSFTTGLCLLTRRNSSNLVWSVFSTRLDVT